MFFLFIKNNKVQGCSNEYPYNLESKCKIIIWDKPLTPYSNEYEIIYPDDPRINLDLQTLISLSVKILKFKTYSYITNKMPEWKQISYNKYIGIHDKITNGERVSEFDQSYYDNFPDNDLTTQQMYEYCINCLNWINQCIAENDRIEILIHQCTNITEIDNLTVNYPNFPY